MKYEITLSGNIDAPYWVLCAEDGSELIDMFFSYPDKARKYAEKKGLELVEKPEPTIDNLITALRKEGLTESKEIAIHTDTLEQFIEAMEADIFERKQALRIALKLL